MRRVPDADEESESGPERTCVVTRRSGSPDSLIRFVLGPEAMVTPDLKRKLPGRGVWVTASAATIAEAVKKGAFSRGFKSPAKASPTLVEDLGDLLERDALQSLSIANKAGLVITGFAKVESAIGGKAGVVLVHASDAAWDGRRKLGQVCARSGADLGEPVNLFDSAQLGLALGRPHVIHAALGEGAATAAFLARCRKLALFRGVATGEADAG
jgi:predicted RNA-binding protein YlxR (DUF448 family)